MQNNEENRDEHLANGDSSTLPNIKKEIFHQPDLEELRSLLANKLKMGFEDVVVKITSCPLLTKEPFNLAEIGLHGNTAIIECDTSTTYKVWDMLFYFIIFVYDSFIIGGGFGARPFMPFSGYFKLQGLNSIANFYGELLLQFAMNATFSQPAKVNNASRLFAIRINGQERMEIMNTSDKMTVCATGNFFMSEGRPGRVLEVRAKNRKCSADIITMIENALSSHYSVRNKVIGLGGVLLINKGKILVSVIPEDIPGGQIITSNDLINRTRDRVIKCMSTITTLGTIVSEKINSEKPRPRHFFYIFSENNIGGRFVNDITPNETEYVGYFNVAEYMIVNI